MRVLPIIAATVLGYFVLYSPQPLLPLFAQTFSVSESRAALLTTATLLPLSIAPLTYGYLLESISAVRMLKGAVLAMALSSLAFAAANSFAFLIGVRFVQGLLLPAALTAIMTYISATVSGSRLRRVMSIYITSTIIGGFLGRLLAGFFATFLTWRSFYLLLAAALLGSFLLLGRLPRDDVRLHSERLKLTAVLQVLRAGGHAGVYLSVFFLFFAFAALLNFIPFRLAELRGQPSELLTGLMYSGYLMGAIASLAAGRLTVFLRGEKNAMTAGFLCYLVALVLTLAPNEWSLFLSLFLFCGAMFFVHTVAATLVNHQAKNRGITNGLYIAFYYGGGVVGSYLPGVVYERYGWNAFTFLLLAAAGTGLMIVAWYKMAGKETASLILQEKTMTN